MNQKNLLLTISIFLFSTVSLFAQISGTVFRDFNGNGTKDANEPLIAGVTVNAYSSTGASCGTAISTAGAGVTNYTLSGCGTGDTRVEFILPSSGRCVNSNLDFSALSGGTYGTSVQFVKGNASAVNFALFSPSDYNQGTTNVSVFIPCYISGDPLVSGAAADGDWFIGYPYTNSGATTATPPSQKVNGAIIGPTWGVAYSKQANKIFTSALVKRHVGLGSLGSGGIYMLTPTATSFTVNSFYDMDANSHRTRAAASAPAYGEGTSYSIAADNSTVTYLGSVDALTGKPAGLGVIGTNVQRGLTSDPLDPSFDPAAFDQVGKVGLGDIDISDDGKFLFVMNLYSRKVFRLELNSASNPTSIINVTSYDVPATTCANGEYRPWGLKFFRNKLYVGVVCSGENGGTLTDVNASVYELNNPTATATFNSSALVTVPLEYNRADDWHPWTNDSEGVLGGGGAVSRRYGTPLLSDIEFTDNGDMVLGLMDRSGHQWGENNRRFLKTEVTSITITGVGDVLVAGLNCNSGSFTLENDGSVTSANGTVLTGSSSNLDEGPGGKEFFNDDSNSGDPHDETTMGSVAVLKGQGELILPAFAQTTNSGDAGTMKLSTTNGSYVAGSFYELYNRDVTGVFAKANGLGDVELSGIEAPIEIGNRIWKDTDLDGVQDAGEAGINGVEIELYEGTTATGVPVQTVTSATVNGQVGTWFFTNLKANQAYVIKVKTALGAGALAACTAYSPTGAGTSLIDNNTSNGTISLTTGNAGENNHTYDIGVTNAVVCSVTLTATPGVCVPATNLYQVTGNLTFTTAPATGTLTVSVGGQQQVFNAPFTSPQAYAITGLTSDGASKTVTAIFSATPACTNTATYTAPANCTPTCVTPTPTGVAANRCGTGTVTLTASGCDATYPARWYSNQGLTTQVGTGNSFTTPSITTTTDYYVACVETATPTCKSTGVLVKATINPNPTISTGTPVCNEGGTAFEVGYTATPSSIITTSVGTVDAVNNKITGVPSGQTVTITATLNGCTATATATATCAIPCPTPNCVGVTVIKN